MPELVKDNARPDIFSGVIETNITEIGDKRLDPKEGVASQREKCLQSASKYKIEDQDELTNAERACGARLPFATLIAKLQRIAPALSVRDGSPGSVALYWPRNSKQLYDALTEGGSSDEFFIFNHYVGGFPKEEIPEWGWLDIDTSLIATREHLRGWRTVLIGLMHAGVISYGEAVKEFGDPINDQRNTVWMKKTLEWRQNPSQKFTLSEYVEAQRK